MNKTAYTIGNQASYDEALDTEPVVHKIGRTEDYSGGCCWATYKEALEWMNKNKSTLPYTPKVYSLILPNGWKEDTTNDTYESNGYYSLLNKSIIKHCNLKQNKEI